MKTKRRPAPPVIECGCCHQRRPHIGNHAILGPLCYWCAVSFDYRLTWDAAEIRPGWSCPTCFEQGEPCQFCAA